MSHSYVTPELLMNISGKSVALALRAHIQPPTPTSVIVLHDSLSHKPYAISAKFGGSANGHNGVSSVINALGDNRFHRLRLGIGRPEGLYHDYVLEKLSDEERKWWGGNGEGVDTIWTKIEEIIMARATSSK
jgi:PTH1 family peptidyl-tRNA hydrolase